MQRDREIEVEGLYSRTFRYRQYMLPSAKQQNLTPSPSPRLNASNGSHSSYEGRSPSIGQQSPQQQQQSQQPGLARQLLTSTVAASSSALSYVSEQLVSTDVKPWDYASPPR
jgi:hypothetical protein|eukprot:COSAG06_NODE_6147_length_3086_cov_24.392779_3_plen_112_part_00